MADSQAKPSGIRDLKTAADLAEKRKELEQLRGTEKRDWALNREFYKGNQYAHWNRAFSRIEQSLPAEDADSPRYLVRLVSNQIRPGVQHYVAQLTKNRPVINAVADSGGDRDIKAAQMAERLYEWWWQEFGLNAKLQSALVHATLSQGYWKITWDPLAGKSMRMMVSPQDGRPITDDELADVLRDTLRENGLDPAKFEKTAYMGDIKVEVMPGENVLLDPAAATFEDAQYAICLHNMDPDEVKARYGETVLADTVPGDESIPLAWLPPDDQRPKTTKRIYIGYFRPQPALPKGRYVVWMESPDKILVDEPWPYPFSELPIVKFPGLERPDSPLDTPVVSDARPLQKEMNRTISQVVMHKNLTLKPQMLAPQGSLRQRLTTEPGAVFEYQPIGGMAPQWREMPNLPGYVFEHLSDLQRRLDQVFNRIPTQRDQLPARVDAPGSIDLIQEGVADQLSPVIIRLEDALARAGMLMVQLAQKYYIEPRLLKIKGSGGSVQVKKFMNSDLQGGFSFHAEAGSGLPRTRAGKQARIEFLLEQQLISPKDALKMLDIADMSGVSARLAADEDQALREHERLIKGEPISPQAVQQAIQQAQQMMMDPTADPNGDGEVDSPAQKQAQAQQMVMQAMVEPTPYEDYETHLDTHALFMKSVEFEGLPPDVQQRFIDHFGATYDRYWQLKMMTPGEVPKVSLQLKGTTSAPVAGEILRRTGIQVSDDEVALPPLETWVTDSVDKADVDQEGNNHLEQAGQLQQMQQAQDQHELKQAKAAHEASLASAKVAGTQQQAAASAADAQRAQQAHLQKLRHAEELHQARLKQLKKAGTKSGR